MRMSFRNTRNEGPSLIQTTENMKDEEIDTEKHSPVGYSLWRLEEKTGSELWMSLICAYELVNLKKHLFIPNLNILNQLGKTRRVLQVI